MWHPAIACHCRRVTADIAAVGYDVEKKLVITNMRLIKDQHPHGFDVIQPFLLLHTAAQCLHHPAGHDARRHGTMLRRYDFRLQTAFLALVDILVQDFLAMRQNKRFRAFIGRQSGGVTQYQAFPGTCGTHTHYASVFSKRLTNLRHQRLLVISELNHASSVSTRNQ